MKIFGNRMDFDFSIIILCYHTIQKVRRTVTRELTGGGMYMHIFMLCPTKFI